MTLILASGSATRQQLLRNAGVLFEAVVPPVDETEIKSQSPGAPGVEIASRLAEAKAIAISRNYPEALTIGADQVLELAGNILDKPRTIEEAHAQLRLLSGSSHELIAAVCCAREGKPLWQHWSKARLKVRRFSDGFLDNYLEGIGERAFASVGAYQLEGAGVQLFEAIEGDYFTILGLPMLPLLNFLRSVNEIGA